MSLTDDAVEHHPHIEENVCSIRNCKNSKDSKDEKASQRPVSSIVLSRRGRWVIKLALAIFLMRQGITVVGELTVLHSEIWRHDSLGIESRARGYVRADASLVNAESVWKRKLGDMWLHDGFEACEEELEPYFIKELAKHRPHRKTETAKDVEETKGTSVEQRVADSNADVGSVSEPRREMSRVEVEHIQQLVKLYHAATRYARSVEPVACSDEQGWIAAAELFEYLQKVHYLPIKGYDGNYQDKDNREDDSTNIESGEYKLQPPTTPEDLLLLLQHLDILGRLQFRLKSHNAGTTTENTRVDSLRVTWAYTSKTVNAAVLMSHPKLLLSQVLETFSPPLALYDFVENVTLWRREMTKYGGRVMPSFRPFLLLVPSDSIRQHTIVGDSNGIIGVSALVASKLTDVSAFIRVSDAFLQMHRSHHVRVIHSLLSSDTAENSSTPVVRVMLLPIDEIDTTAIATHEKSGMCVIKAALLYGGGGDSNIAVDALCPTRDDTCSTENAMGTFSSHLTQTTLHVEDVPIVQGVNGVLNVNNGPRFNSEGARQALRLMADESKLALDASTALSLGDICSRWLLANTKLLHDNCHSIVSDIRNSEFKALSLILPCNNVKRNEPLHGCRVEVRCLGNELEAGDYSPLRVLSKRKKKTMTVYYGEGVCLDQIATTPLLVLRRLQDRTGCLQALIHAKEAAAQCCAVLILPLSARDGSYGKDNISENEGERSGEISCNKEMMDYIALEIDGEEAQEWLCDNDATNNNNDNDNSNDSNNSGGRMTLRSVEVDVEEWVLCAALPIDKFMETEFAVPVEQSLRTSHNGDTPFARLSEQTQTSLLQSLRQHLLLAVTPGENEALEYLGDAMLDFIIVQEELNTWTQGSLVGGASNANLSNFLPDALARHLLVMFHVCCDKRKADVVEALIGAVVQALWVIPRQGKRVGGASRGSRTPELESELLPFTSLLQAVRAIMAVMKIK